MRIDSFQPVQNTQVEEKSSPKQAKHAGAGKVEDQASFSAESLKLASLSQVDASSQARSEKVEALRKAVAGGQYSVSSEKIADALIDKGFDRR